MALESPRGQQYRPLPEKGAKRYLKPIGGLLAALAGLALALLPFMAYFGDFGEPAEKEALDAGEALVFEGRYEEAVLKLTESASTRVYPRATSFAPLRIPPSAERTRPSWTSIEP